MFGIGGGVKVNVQVVPILSEIREPATSIRTGRTDVDKAAIAYSKRARARMIREAREKTSARARATASALQAFHQV